MRAKERTRNGLRASATYCRSEMFLQDFQLSRQSFANLGFARVANALDLKGQATRD